MHRPLSSGAASEDEPQHACVELQVRVRQFSDQLSELSAEINQLRACSKSALERASPAAESSQRAEVISDDSAARLRGISVHVTAAVLDSGAGHSSSGLATSLMTRDQLVGRIEHLEAVLNRRSVQTALTVKQTIRWSALRP